MIQEKLDKLGIVLPDAPVPAGSYVPAVTTDGLVFISGQIPIKDGKVAYTGKVSDRNIDDARESAKLCALNILSQLKRLDALENVEKIIKISGFVNSDPEFTSHPKVINAASDLLFEVFGQAGSHSRIAVGVASLPLGAMTEIDAIIKLRD